MKIFLLLPLSVLFLKTCQQQPQPGLPACLAAFIDDYKKRPVQNPPAEIFQYHYNGQVVYYVKPPCCDQLSQLYDSSCQIICSPDGGFTGRGDGKCPDFHALKKDEKLIWKDERME